ncbi:MAG: HlyD family efflux transporter periplasmic adaptor subunit [Pirellulaceae bacterium]
MSTASLPLTAVTRPLDLAMRRDLGVYPLRFSGRNYWGVKDPVALRYYQLRDEEYYILRQLDGRTSLEEIQQRFEKQFAPLRLDVRQLQRFLGTLHRQGLIVSLAPEQGEQLIERRGRERRRQYAQAAASILAIRFRGIDPEPFLVWLYPKVGWFFSRGAAVCVLLLALAAMTLAAVQFETLQSRLPDFHAFFNAQNALWLMVALGLAKVLHELGHALACKRFGGECHELGVMLLVFTPCLYCNVTDSWMMPNKWHRAAIAAAGMYVEVALASVCTFLWWFSEPGLFNSMCLNVMFVSSVSTLLFNGNPLLRYDGYYILSDLLETPNLQQRSSSVVKSALSQWLLDVDPPVDRLMPENRRGVLAAYAVASTIYRFVVIFGILWFVREVLKPYRLEIVAELVALVVVVGLFVGPVMGAIAFLRHPGRRREVNWLRFGLLSIAAAALMAVVLLVPLPQRVYAPVVVEPHDAERLYVSAPGRLVEAARIGDSVAEGDVVAELKNLELTQEIVALEGDVRRQEKHLDNLRHLQVGNQEAGAQIPAAREALADLRQQLASRLEDRQKLTIVSPRAGVLMPPRKRRDEAPVEELPEWNGVPLDQENQGAWLETGTLLCLVGVPANLEGQLVIDQADVDLVEVGQTVRLQLDEAPGEIVTGVIEEISQLDLDVAPPELVAAGVLPMRGDSKTPQLASAAYLARVRLDGHEHPLRIRTTGEAKVLVEPASLAWRLWRYLSRTFRFEW